MFVPHLRGQRVNQFILHIQTNSGNLVFNPELEVYNNWEVPVLNENEGTAIPIAQDSEESACGSES